ncbi:MAG: cbb3-type cytochrome c oxidase subunit I [Nitrosomonadales bacterium]|nr:cbb3-type cytochrome c oxidase subunit I [Nitrosomonadales bacterium]
MSPTTEHPYLVKFVLMSAASFFVGAMHGMLQVIPAVRLWLDSIGSPFGGPGHMIDPLAHAHLNLVGGVVILAMGISYYLLPIFSGKPIYSQRLINHSFWWTSMGVFFFYTTLIIFGVWEGNLLLSNSPDQIVVHGYYGPVVAGSGIVMATGFGVYMLNIALTLLLGKKASA